MGVSTVRRAEPAEERPLPLTPQAQPQIAMSRKAAVLAGAGGLLAVILVIVGVHRWPASTWSPVPAGTPTAHTGVEQPSIGALFTGGLAGGHSCSGGVLAGPDRDLVITAAHCLSAGAAGDLFVPGYARGATPDGVWVVTKAWVTPAWLVHRDPHDDVALLRVAPRSVGGRLLHLQDLTGGLALGSAPAPGTVVTVAGYAAGMDDEPLTCTAPTLDVGSYPTFRCRGYVGGTSGSPFLVEDTKGRTRIVGVIGGPERGGCQDWQSFSSPFDQQVRHLLARARTDAPADQAPSVPPLGCLS